MKQKNLFFLLLLCFLTIIPTGCTNDDEPENGNGNDSSASLTVNGKSTKAQISVFSYMYGQTEFSYDVFRFGDEGTWAFDFYIEEEIDSDYVDEDIAEELYVRKMSSLSSAAPNGFDYEYLSGKVIVKSCSRSKITLQFNDYTFKMANYGQDNWTTYKVKGTASFTLDGTE